MMANLPAMLSLKHFLVLSLALNVSLILRMVYESDHQQGSNNNKIQGYNRIIQKSRLAISSITSFANSTRKDHSGIMDKIINLDQ
jgi:L-tryptophan--pyruvate aminotransferase